MLAHLRAQHRSVESGFPTTCSVQLPLRQGTTMLHHVCLLHHRGSQELKLFHPMLLFVLKMVYASSAANQVTLLRAAARLRISWLFLVLAVAMVVATIRPATIILGLLLMVVDMLTTLILKKSRINLLL